MSESTPETVLDDKLMHDIVTGNLLSIIEYHARESARKALPIVLLSALMGKKEDEPMMEALLAMAEALSTIQDMVSLILEHTGPDKTRRDEISNLNIPVEEIKRQIELIPKYKDLMDRAVEAQMLTTAQKMEKAKGSTDPEVIFRNMGAPGFDL
jgi:hypothetical protein